MEFRVGEFDFNHFIDRRYANTRSGNSNFEPIPHLPDDVHPQTRKQIEAIVSSIDVVSVKALLLRAVVDHERHIGKLVSLHCETFSKTCGRLWKCGDEMHKFAGDIYQAIDTLDILMVERILVDGILTFRNVAARVSAEFKRRSRTMERALLDIQYCHDLCRALIRELSEEWRNNGTENQLGLVRTSEGAAAKIASTLTRLPLIMENEACWETRRNTMLTYQKIADALINELPRCEESFWGNLLTPLMLHISQVMTDLERNRYVHEGLYYGLLKLCPFLPDQDTNILYRQFPIGSEMIERSRAEEFAVAMRILELRRRQPNALQLQEPRLNGHPNRITKLSKKKKKKQRRRTHAGPAVAIKAEQHWW